MYYVYLLTSGSHTYIGSTADLRDRLKRHNRGAVSHTSQYHPWTLHTYIAFQTKQQAQKFERYLKTGSGRSFADRHLFSHLLFKAGARTGRSEHAPHSFIE